ncbi:hypothetical protein Indivirus_11_10 [Indivirus ILV1]|uniref:Zinc transporter n=1 Tax=Indivirus ILV1 TaxID=1977633 RepID=A0A1V0SED0_9VIRU|nr:hypothetical protein Indivirus_11_10 [Indivirus ILV1]
MDNKFLKHGIKVKHNNHTGYLLNGELRCKIEENENLVPHILDHEITNCNNNLDCIHPKDSIKVPHLDHHDYIIGTRIHHDHNDHCDDHGEIKLIKKNYVSTYIKFAIMITLIGLFMIAEFVIGTIGSSLALQADAFHMLSDLAALIIALYSIKVNNKKQNHKATFGYTRAEIIGAFVNAIFLMASCFFILLEAIQRFIKITEVEQNLLNNINMVLITAGIGGGINIIGIIMFSFSKDDHHGHSHSHNHDHDEHNHGHDEHSHGHDEHSHGHDEHSHGHDEHSHDHGHNHKGICCKYNLNILGVLLHIIGDLFGSIGVVISCVIIKYTQSPERFYADPAMSIIIVIIILCSSIPLAYKCINILMHKVPSNIDIKKIKKKLLKINGVNDIHHFHVWQHNDKVVIGTLHVIISDITNVSDIINNVENILHKSKIHTTTIQIEFLQEQNNCSNIVCSKKECHVNMCCDDY